MFILFSKTDDCKTIADNLNVERVSKTSYSIKLLAIQVPK